MTANFFCPVDKGARLHPDSPALITENYTWSYSQLNCRVTAIQAWLKAQNFSVQTCLAVKSSDTVAVIVLLLACIREGIVFCPLNDRLPMERFQDCLKVIQPDFVIDDSSAIATAMVPPRKARGSFFPALCGGQSRFHLRPKGRGFTKRGINNISPDKVTPSGLSNTPQPLIIDKPAVIIMTSGTSGNPKAVALSYENLYFNTLGARDCIPLVDSDRWLLSLPLYHVGGLGIVLRTFWAGAAVVVPRHGQNTSELIERHGVTHLSVVTTQLYRLLEEKKGDSCKSLKVILLGGGPISHCLIEKSLCERLPLFISYGLTEMASQVATSPVKSSQELSAKVLPYREVLIDRHNEIGVRGKTLFLGYWDKKKITCPLTKDGWFATGDLGKWKADGELIVLGRKDNMFTSFGEKVYPEEIERKLAEMPGIAQVVVIQQAHAEFGAVPVAFIAVFDPVSLLTKAKITAFLSARLEKYKIPAEYYFLPPGFGSAGFKPDRQAVKGLLVMKNQLTAIR